MTSMRVLIVEDELRVATAIKRSLGSSNFAADIVSNGEDGLSYGADSDYDLVILDRMLPGGISGLDICKSLRERGVTIPILMLTALGEVDDRVSGLSAGADDYLVKPFSMQELIVRVQALLRRPKTLAGPIIKVADLEVNVETFDTKRHQVPIKLSAREFRLLIYLLRNQNRTVSKETIISHAWNEEALIMPNTVEVYVGILRKKIDRAFPGSPPLIHTVHGFGYKLGVNNV